MKMQKLFLTFLIFSFSLLKLDAQKEIINNKYNACVCQHQNTKMLSKPYYEMEFNKYEFTSCFITCCAKEFTSTKVGNFTVTWSFTGENTLYSTLKPKAGCFNQVLTTDRLDLDEAGNHTCEIRTQNGNIFRKFIKMRIHKSWRKGAVPKVFNNSGTTYTSAGKSSSLNCIFFFENGSKNLDIYWRKISINRTGYYERIADTLEGVKVRSFIVGGEYYVSQLIFENITEKHFGNYSCNAVTFSKVISQNISVIDEVHPNIRTERKWKVALSLSVVALIWFVASLLALARFRYILAWKWADIVNSFKGADENKFSHDMFIIHGPTMTSWVCEVLLKQLEQKWSYDCFVPERDTLGGEVNIETICQEIASCEVIIVVISDCFLESNWGSFVTFQAIHSSLVDNTKVVAINLMGNLATVKTTAETRPILSVLKLMKKIPCPATLVPRAKGNFEKESTDFMWDSSSVLSNMEKYAKHYETSGIVKQDGSENQSLSKNVFSSSLSPYFSSLSSLPSFFTNSPHIRSTNLAKREKTTFNLAVKEKLALNLAQNKEMSLDLAEKGNIFSEENLGLSRNKNQNTPENFVPVQRHSNMVFDSQIKGNFPKYEMIYRENPYINQEKRNQILYGTGSGSKIYRSVSENPISPGYETDFLKIKTFEGNKKSQILDSDKQTKHNSSICTNFIQNSNSNFGHNKKKSFLSPLEDIFYGSPDTLFWQRLRIHLPKQKKKFKNRTNYDI